MSNEATVTNDNSEDLTGAEQVENPVEDNEEIAPETPEDEGLDDVLASLDSVDLGEEEQPKTANGEASSVKEAEEQIDEATRKLQAQMTAAVATGGVATVLERVLSPVVVTDDMRKDFSGALAQVLEKQGAGMPPWFAKLLDEWKAEMMLARKTVAIGYAIYEHHRDIKAGDLKPSTEKKRRYRLPSSMTTNRTAEAA